MTSIHVRKEEACVASLLARMAGQRVTHTMGARPVFTEPVPEPNRTTILEFHRSMVAEGLTIGRIEGLLPDHWKLAAWAVYLTSRPQAASHRPPLAGRCQRTAAYLA